MNKAGPEVWDGEPISRLAEIGLSADADGNIRYEVDAPPGKKFFRAGPKP